ncbi:hypothetical protein CPB83DRAFT_536897 [Crepidotus variabilis]|uniref:Uncharacterized protein n=1 Tax=Crepidotus variabilis TaxID=179855 RepID=A0A9P6EQT0_9AGAR|nr:hypothetical protein CPB83DRAFT_536897 [Crepidotus variabilis]
MPPRPTVKPKQSRPLSAVYIGKGAAGSSPSIHGSSPLLPSSSFGTSPGLPDLPEPPSPSSSIGSVKSGLPSPPATNSTGSGSTGDPATIALRDRPLSLHSNSSTSTSSGSYAATTPIRRTFNAPNSRSSSRLGDRSMEDAGADADFDDDYDANDLDNDNNADGDDTARLNRKPLGGSSNELEKSRGSTENQSALLRAKSLAQRNRLALDKLSRLGSPSPARAGTPNSRSPAPSHAGSSRSQSTRQVRALPQPPKNDLMRSGSETERESEHHSHSTSTHSRSSHSSSSHAPSIPSMQRSVSHSATPARRSATPPNTGKRKSPQTSPYNRLRHISAPASPHKARLIAASSSSDSNHSNSPSHRRRSRASMASVQLTDFEEEDDALDDRGPNPGGTAREPKRDRTFNEHDLITQSALAAVASSRRSPLGNKRRGALPREFRSDLADGSPPNGDNSGRKSSAGRFDTMRLSPDARRYSPENGRNTWREPVTPFRTGVGRSSTVREHRNGPNPRWSSDDFRSPTTSRQREFNTSMSNDDSHRERRQSLRGGSAESALAVWSPGGRTLLGEGLRAAGLTRKREAAGRRAGGNEPTSNGDVLKERVRKVDWSPEDTIADGRTRAMVDRERERGAPAQRASTSMAHYQYQDRDSPDAPREHILRGHRSTFSLASKDRERDAYTSDRSTSVLDRYSAKSGHPPTPRLNVAHLQDRLTTSSPFGTTRRYSAQPPTPQTEHGKLMVDSLTMFESALSKVPRNQPLSTSLGPGTGSAHTDLLQNAQGMVFAADRLCSLLKQGSARAVESQVEAEVESATRDSHTREIVDLWGNVAADYREGSRTADELIRGITGLLLGMGKVMREVVADRGGVSEFGSPAIHGRHVSLGEDDLVRRVSPDIGHRHHGSGHASGQGSRSGGGSHAEGSSGRQSVASRHSWDPSRDKDKDREDALRRLAGDITRSESVLARASPATFQRLKDHDGYPKRHQTFETPPPASLRSSVPQSAGPAASIRRLFTPRDRRDDLPPEETSTSAKPMVTLDSQETVHPSPTPASRQLRGSPAVDRPRPLPPLAVPKPLPTLPSERRSLDKSADTPLSTRERERRRATNRGNERPTPPSITSPANPTIALTPHTVSNNPERSPFPRTGSSKTQGKVTFSRPSAVSVSKSLSEQLHQSDHEPKRTISITSVEAEADPSSLGARNYVVSPVSGSESENTKRKSLAVRSMRMSLDSQRDDEERGNLKSSDVHAADRSAASTILPSTGRRERRRTVTDIWLR